MKVTGVIEYVRRCTLNTTNLNTVHKRQGRSGLYHIVENDFSATVTTEWKLDSRVIAAERASLKRASEAAGLICVCRGEFISNHVYRSALWSCAFGNAQNTFPHL